MTDTRDPGPEAVDKILDDLEGLVLQPAEVARQARRLRAHIRRLRRAAATPFGGELRLRAGSCAAYPTQRLNMGDTPIPTNIGDAEGLLACPFCGEVPTHRTSSGLVVCTNADCPIEVSAFSVSDWNRRPTPTVPVEDAELVERLREQARREEAAHKMMADAKTARQTDREDAWTTAGYDWVHAEQTDSWKAAARLTALSTRNAVLEEAARKALNFIENTEGELGIQLDSGDALRAALTTKETKDATD